MAHTCTELTARNQEFFRSHEQVVILIKKEKAVTVQIFVKGKKIKLFLGSRVGT